MALPEKNVYGLTTTNSVYNELIKLYATKNNFRYE